MRIENIRVRIILSEAIFGALCAKRLAQQAQIRLKNFQQNDSNADIFDTHSVEQRYLGSELKFKTDNRLTERKAEGFAHANKKLHIKWRAMLRKRMGFIGSHQYEHRGMMGTRYRGDHAFTRCDGAWIHIT